MPRAIATKRPFARAFAVMGGVYIAAMAALLIAAGLGWTAPALVGASTAWLVAGGAVTVLAIAVPVALFGMHRYARSATEHVAALQRETHQELHAANNSAMGHIDEGLRRNEGMHATDREAMAALGRRLDAHRRDIQNRALTSDQQHLRDELLARVQAMQKVQESSWQDHERIHAEANEALAWQHKAAEDAMTEIRRRLHQVETGQSAHGRKIQADEAANKQAVKALQDALQDMRVEQRQFARGIEDRLQTWQLPEDQMGAWSERVNAHTDHELARFRHKVQHQLDQFEKRGLHEVALASRKAHEDAAVLSEDIARARMAAVDERIQERLADFEKALDERFGALQAGQLAQRVEDEARLAAVGASRGVKVQSGDAYTVTSHAPFGRVYPIADVEGIGNKTAYTLQRLGILDTEHLWHADVPTLAAELDVTPKQIRQWQSQAELMAIDGIGPQWGELLATAGVVSIAHLANLHARELMELIQAHGRVHRQRLHKGAVNLAKAEDFIARAREHKPERVVHV